MSRKKIVSALKFHTEKTHTFIVFMYQRILYCNLYFLVRFFSILRGDNYNQFIGGPTELFVLGSYSPYVHTFHVLLQNERKSSSEFDIIDI